MNITRACIRKEEFAEVVSALKEAGYPVEVKKENLAFTCANNSEVQKIVRQYASSGTTGRTGYI